MKRHHGISLASAALGALTFSLGLSLVACGSDSSSSNDDNKDSSGIVEYGTLDEMAHCTKSHYGEFAHVAETDSIYECTSEGWVVADSSRIEELLSSSDSKGDDEKSSSSIAVSAGDTAKVEIVEVESVTALGLAEKGPFAKGSVVNVRGLDSDLNKTRTSFKGSVNDDKGNYSVSKINLSSQYAMVEVNGFFNNEVTGKVTAGTRTKLRALVDLSEGDTVKANVNVLTDLEYERAVALVKNEKYNVPAAKIRATKEILSAFGVTADSVTATKLSFAGKGAATNGLLAASVALMGNLSLSKFQTRLGDVAKSFAETGSIDDTLRAEIADGLSLLDSNGTLATIMKNIEALNSKATGVDSLLYAFWSDNYKLPACDAKTEETIAKNDNKLSSYYGSGYACTNNRWHKSTALDTELGLCVAKNEGKYEISKARKYYTCKAGQWREITKDQYELGACTEDVAKDALKKYKIVGGEYYLCKNLQWEVITVDDYELKDCGTDNNEKIVSTETSKVSYACLDGAWRKATDIEVAIGYICSAKNGGKFGKVESQDYHCDGKAWTKITALEAELGLCADSTSAKWKQSGAGEYYNCAANSWTEVTEYEYNLQKFCTTSNKGAVEKDDDKGYVCEADGWRQLDDVEYKFGYCEPSIKDSVIWTGVFVGALPSSDDLEGQFLVCNGSKWVDSKRADFLYGVCNESLQGTYKDVNSIIYENPGDTAYRWPENCEAVTLCKNMKRIYYGDRPDLVYAKCENGEWIPSTYADVYMFRKNETCSNSGEGRKVTYSEKTFACFQEKWYETIKDSRDNQVYRITRIGAQTWMAENLNYDYKGVKYDYEGKNFNSTSWCYENEDFNCEKYGRLYTWSAAMDSAAQFSGNIGTKCGLGETCTPNSPHRGVCPVGWHLPTYDEWRELFKAVGDSSTAGKILKSSSGWNSNGNGTNAYGFSAFPAGLRATNAYLFEQAGDITYFWSTTQNEYSSKSAWSVDLYYKSSAATWKNFNKNIALSVRCLKD